jgi:hypothetical protein
MECGRVRCLQCSWELGASRAEGSRRQPQLNTDLLVNHLQNYRFYPTENSLRQLETSWFVLCRAVISRLFENDKCIGGRAVHSEGNKQNVLMWQQLIQYNTLPSHFQRLTPQMTAHCKYTKHNFQRSQTLPFSDTVHICHSNYAKNNQPFFPCTAWTVFCL